MPTRSAPILRDALKHRATINREAGLPRLARANQEIGEGRLSVPGNLREQRLEFRLAAVPKAAMITPEAPAGP